MISAAGVRRLGLHVSSKMPPEVLELMTLYPQPVRRFPTVEYLPGRRVPNEGLSRENLVRNYEPPTSPVQRLAERDACPGRQRRSTWEV
jgi:hypothetical protein